MLALEVILDAVATGAMTLAGSIRARAEFEVSIFLWTIGHYRILVSGVIISLSTL